jgi:putative PEP-CTERM system histidine kinase
MGFLLGASAYSGYLMCILLYPLAAIATWRSGMSRARKYAMIACCLVMAAWAAGSVSGLEGGIPGGISFGLEILRSLLWLALFLVYLAAETGLLRRLISRRRMIAAGALIAVVLAVAVVAIIIEGQLQILFFWQILVSVATLLSLENLLRNCDEGSRWGVRLISLAAGFVVVYDLFYYVTLLTAAEFDQRFIIMRGYLAAAGAPVLALAMIRSNRWRSNLALSRHVVFHSAALAGAGFYLVSTSLIGEYLRHHIDAWGTAFEMAFLVAASVILAVILQSASVRAQLMVLISKHFFRLKYDYRSVWLNFIRHMSDRETHPNLHDRALRAVAEAIQCKSGVLWSLEHTIGAYVPNAVLNCPTDDLPMILAEEDLPRYLLQTGWIVDLPQFRRDPEFYAGLSLPDWIVGESWGWILIPLIHNQQLEAFLILGAPETRAFVLEWEEFDLLKTVGAQSASYLAEERASRELVDARRMAEINRRFAFMLHDIKNVVSQMSMMLKNVEKHGNNPEFQKDMVETVANAVDRLREMLVHLGSIERPTPRSLSSEVDLGAVLAGAVKRWRKSLPDLAFIPPEMPVIVSGTEERLLTVIDNLLQNAVEAIGPGGVVKVSIGATAQEGVIAIADNGPGMSQEFIRNRLFRPLETNKPNGSGIGAFQALKTVRDMGGSLEVESVLGRGTTMNIKLRRIPAGQQQSVNGYSAHADASD